MRVRAGLAALLVVGVALGAAATGSVGASAASGPASSSRARATPPKDPKSNFPAQSIAVCATTKRDTSAGCLLGALHQFDQDLAKEGYKNARFALPSNYRSLTTAQQLFVLADEDRVVRGLPPIAGMDACLDRDASAGAKRGGDPDFACRDRFTAAASNWSGANDPLYSEFLWVYHDGPGGGNVDCPAGAKASHPGCWGHRHVILGAWKTPALMGAADSVADHHGAWGRHGGGEAEEVYGGDTARASFTWAGERRYFAHPVTEQSLRTAIGPASRR